ncbi:hypothetical protein Bxe_B1566 [Paraburkholderia xenovorans LB400]|uniref:Uncharacterized protein n=1 Tax=Paraburkholderia xenovorans (strain LB400) TaxID=266265 RepID=Q13NE1_PARXL|nr:hypothetical protein Bxe_B1566 [Paraburkholderia xenovorans LB400]
MSWCRQCCCRSAHDKAAAAVKEPIVMYMQSTVWRKGAPAAVVAGWVRIRIPSPGSTGGGSVRADKALARMIRIGEARFQQS